MRNEVILILVVTLLCLSARATKVQMPTNTITNSCVVSHYEDVAIIRNDIDSLRMDLNKYVFIIDSIRAEMNTITDQLNQKNNDNTGDVLSVINILVVISISIITMFLSKKQKILGVNVEKYTHEINDSIKHFERRYLTHQDMTNALDVVSRMESIYEEIKRRITSDYSHFVNNTDVDSKYENLFLDIGHSVSKIKSIMNYYNSSDKIPSEEAYFKAVNDLLFHPDLMKMDDQIDSFISEGEKYHKMLNQVIKEINF